MEGEGENSKSNKIKLNCLFCFVAIFQKQQFLKLISNLIVHK